MGDVHMDDAYRSLCPTCAAAPGDEREGEQG